MRSDNMDSRKGSEPVKRNLSTADLAQAGRNASEMPPPEVGPDDEDGDLGGADLGEGTVTSGDRRRLRAEERAAPMPMAERAAPTPAGTPSTVAPTATPSTTAEKLEPLFSSELAERFRTQWSAVQSSFVDDPRSAAKRGDELVAQVMKSLAESFASERTHLESQLGQTGEGATEALRLSLRRYRSFFERLLSL